MLLVLRPRGHHYVLGVLFGPAADVFQVTQQTAETTAAPLSKRLAFGPGWRFSAEYTIAQPAVNLISAGCQFTMSSIVNCKL